MSDRAPPILLLYWLRESHPWLRLSFDPERGVPIARPTDLVAAEPGLLDALKGMRERLLPLLRWEWRHGPVTLTTEEVMLLEWLHEDADPRDLPGVVQLHEWTSPVSPGPDYYDSLKAEAAGGPTDPSWHRVRGELVALRRLSREQTSPPSP